MTQNYDSFYKKYGTQYNVDPHLLRSIASTESSENPKAVSKSGAIGLMQFMPETAKSLGIDPTDPEQSVKGAAQLMDQNLTRYGDPQKALMAYNGGTNESRWNNPETSAYPHKVMAWYYSHPNNDEINEDTQKNTQQVSNNTENKTFNQPTIDDNNSEDDEKDFKEFVKQKKDELQESKPLTNEEKIKDNLDVLKYFGKGNSQSALKLQDQLKTISNDKLTTAAANSIYNNQHSEDSNQSSQNNNPGIVSNFLKNVRDFGDQAANVGAKDIGDLYYGTRINYNKAIGDNDTADKVKQYRNNFDNTIDKVSAKTANGHSEYTTDGAKVLGNVLELAGGEGLGLAAKAPIVLERLKNAETASNKVNEAIQAGKSAAEVKDAANLANDAQNSGRIMSFLNGASDLGKGTLYNVATSGADRGIVGKALYGTTNAAALSAAHNYAIGDNSEDLRRKLFSKEGAEELAAGGVLGAVGTHIGSKVADNLSNRFSAPIEEKTQNAIQDVADKENIKNNVALANRDYGFGDNGPQNLEQAISLKNNAQKKIDEASKNLDNANDNFKEKKDAYLNKTYNSHLSNSAEKQAYDEAQDRLDQAKTNLIQTQEANQNHADIELHRYVENKNPSDLNLVSFIHNKILNGVKEGKTEEEAAKEAYDLVNNHHSPLFMYKPNDGVDGTKHTLSEITGDVPMANYEDSLINNPNLDAAQINAENMAHNKAMMNKHFNENVLGGLNDKANNALGLEKGSTNSIKSFEGLQNHIENFGKENYGNSSNLGSVFNGQNRVSTKNIEKNFFAQNPNLTDAQKAEASKFIARIKEKADKSPDGTLRPSDLHNEYTMLTNRHNDLSSSAYSQDRSASIGLGGLKDHLRTLIDKGTDGKFSKANDVYSQLKKIEANHQTLSKHFDTENGEFTPHKLKTIIKSIRDNKIQEGNNYKYNFDKDTVDDLNKMLVTANRMNRRSSLVNNSGSATSRRQQFRKLYENPMDSQEEAQSFRNILAHLGMNAAMTKLGSAGNAVHAAKNISDIFSSIKGKKKIDKINKGTQGAYDHFSNYLLNGKDYQ